MKKLRSKKGESLTETLVAILIVGLTAALLFTMTATAVRMIRKSDAAYDRRYEELSKAEASEGPGRAGFVSVNGKSVSVFFYGDEDSFISYTARP